MSKKTKDLLTIIIMLAYCVFYIIGVLTGSDYSDGARNVLLIGIFLKI